jgi:salicylate hydroxylase
MRCNPMPLRFVAYKAQFASVTDNFQGISQTIEDIGVLHAILTSASDQHISVITKLWQEMRKPRVDRIKAYALWNTHMFLGNKSSPVEKSADPGHSWDSVQIVEPDATAAFNSPAFYKWAHDYDAVGEVC